MPSNIATKDPIFVSTTVASQIIGCSRYSLVVQAKKARKIGMNKIGNIRFIFIGNRLKLCKADLNAYYSGGEYDN